MKLNIQVALDEGDSQDYTVELADGTVLTPSNGNVYIDPAPFLKQKEETKPVGETAPAKRGMFGK